MSFEKQIQDLKSASTKWANENPGPHPVYEDYGAMLKESAETIESLSSVKWRRINSRWKPKPKTSIWVYKSGWIYPVIAGMTREGKFLSVEYGEIFPEWWAPVSTPIAPKEADASVQEDSDSNSKIDSQDEWRN